MKRKRNSLKSSRKRKRNRISLQQQLYLPDECWEHVFKFILNHNNYDDEDNRRYFNSLSVVSKQFLSITNRLRFSLTICNPTRTQLCRLFKRFTSVTSIDVTRFHGDLNVILRRISRFPLNLKSLNISHQSYIPANGLRDFSKKIKTLTSLTCSNIGSINSNDMFLIANCFPLLEELYLGKKFKNYHTMFVTSRFIDPFVSLKGLTCLDLSFWCISDELLSSIAREGLPLRKLVLANCIGYSYDGIFSLLSKCQCIQHLDLQGALFLNDHHVVELSLFLGELVSIDLSECWMLTEIALFSLVRNCHSLSEIKIESNDIGLNGGQNSNSLMDFVVNLQLKSLYLTRSSSLRDKNIIMFASIFPNLQLLDLSSCPEISKESIYQVLRRCCNIRHLNLAYFNAAKLLRINFEVPKLEMLNLSYTNVDDETLHVISKSCRGLLQLLLMYCHDVTKRGVQHVVKNCTQLREIYLEGCDKVSAKVVSMMVKSRPSLRRITAPPRVRFSDKKREYFLRHGCIVC